MSPVVVCLKQARLGDPLEIHSLRMFWGLTVSILIRAIHILSPLQTQAMH